MISKMAAPIGCIEYSDWVLYYYIGHLRYGEGLNSQKRLDDSGCLPQSIKVQLYNADGLREGDGERVPLDF